MHINGISLNNEGLEKKQTEGTIDKLSVSLWKIPFCKLLSNKLELVQKFCNTDLLSRIFFQYDHSIHEKFLFKYAIY